MIKAELTEPILVMKVVSTIILRWSYLDDWIGHFSFCAKYYELVIWHENKNNNKFDM